MYYVGPIGGTSHELFKTPLLALGIINLKGPMVSSFTVWF